MERELLFDSSTWLIWLAPFLGVLAAGLSRRRDPRIEGDRVLRHDGVAILEHWTHGLGTAVLLVSGIALGVFSLPALVGGGEPLWGMMDLHFIAAVVFLFGTFYYAANTLMARHRFAEHLPTADALDHTIRHLAALLGSGKAKPAEGKYFESEKIAYVLALATSALIVVTGLLKVAAYSLDVPAGLMAVVTPLHDVAAVAMVLFIVPHVLFAAVLPSAWPLLRSMLTGYVSLEYARREHAAWVEELEEAEEPADAPAPAKDVGAPAA